MPPEWSPQESVWLSWPHRSDLWDGRLELLEAKFAEIAATISRFEFVDLNASADLHDGIRQKFLASGGHDEHLRLHPHPTNDVWCRDHGPLFVKDPAGRVALTNWGFNGWGNKFLPYDLDDSIPGLIAKNLDLPLIDGGMILEGGSIEINGHGQLLTTEAVLLNPNRNPSLSKAEIEERLRQFLGATEILWLKDGIEGDDTDGHIDDLARFTADDTIIAAIDPGGPNEAVLSENLARLKSFRTPDGRPFDIHTVALPQAKASPDWRLPTLPASYVNFLIIEGAVLVPTFAQENDQPALTLIGRLFPEREIIGINCLDLVKEGGSLHCISQQMPARGSLPAQDFCKILASP